MNDAQKIIFLFLWVVVNLILTLVGFTDGFHGEVIGLAVFSWVAWIFLFYNTVGTSLGAEKRAREYELRKPQIEAERNAYCIEKQAKKGLPTQEVLQEIADKFGFTLHGEMIVENGKYKYSRFQIETHKSFEQLRDIGINTYYDIFGKYFLFFKYTPLFSKDVVTYDSHLDKIIDFDDNNLSFRFDYDTKYDENIDVVLDDFIVQIIDKRNKFIVYRNNGISVRNSADELTENERRFVLEAKDELKNYYKGVIRGGCYLSGTQFGDGIHGCYTVSPEKPLILN